MTRTSDLPTRMLAVDGGAIAYDVAGHGPMLVLAPGMGDLRSTYRHLTPLLVDAGYRVVTTDLRGHGDSDMTFRDYGDEPTAADLTALLRELGGGATLVGNSMSAGAAAIVAARSPELVDGLVLVGPFVRDPIASTRLQRWLFAALMARPWAAAAWLAYLPTLYAGAKPADFDEHRARIRASLRRPGAAAAFATTTRTRHDVAEASLPAIAAPTLVVMGDRDPDFPDPAAEAAWIAAATRGGVAMIEDAGHYPHAQQPMATADAILGFLRQAAGGGGARA